MGHQADSGSPDETLSALAARNGARHRKFEAAEAAKTPEQREAERQQASEIWRSTGIGQLVRPAQSLRRLMRDVRILEHGPQSPDDIARLQGLRRAPMVMVSRDPGVADRWLRSSMKVAFRPCRARGAGRPRVRRQQRHTARSTSSSDPGGEPDLDDPDGAGPGLKHIGGILEGYLADLERRAA